MRSPMVLYALALPLLAYGFQTQEEKDLLDHAERTVNTFCPVDFPPLDYAVARANIESSAGKDNPIYNTVLDAEIVSGLETPVLLEALSENIRPEYIAGRAFAFVILIILLVLWLCMCWCFLIPCCQRCVCRECEVHHELGKKRYFHIILWILFGLLAIGCITAQAFSFSAYYEMDAGIQGTACYTAQLVQDGVNGSKDENFLGFLPAVEIVQTFGTLLEPSHPVMVEITGLLDLLDDVEKAVNINLAILRMLVDLVGEPQNVEPAGYMHKCQICKPLADLTDYVLTKVEVSAAFAIVFIRIQARAQLTGPQLLSLRQSMYAVMEPVEEIKAQIVDNIGFFLNEGEGGFQNIMGYIRGNFWTGSGGYLFPAILGLFLLCLVIVIHGIFSLAVFGCCGGRDHDPCCVRYSAGYSLCSSYCYTLLLLLLGGIVVILSTVGSGVCLVMLDFDSEVGKQLLVAVGMDSSELDDVLDVALNLTEQCMSLKVPEAGVNRDLMDLIPIPAILPSYEGEMSTPRREVYDLGFKKIEDAFKMLDDAIEQNVFKLAELPEVEMVLKVIGEINMKSLIWADPVQVGLSLTYSAMNPAYYLTTLNCKQTLLGDDLPDPLAGVRVPGIENMVTTGYDVVETEPGRFEMVLPIEYPGVTIRVEPVIVDMADANFTCPDGFAPGTSACGTGSNSNLAQEIICRAGKAFLEDKKMPLLRDEVFVCKYFQLPGAPWGTACDITNMTFQDSPCIYSNNLSLATFNRPCTLDEFAAQIQNFEHLIRAGLVFVDDTVAGIIDTVIASVRRLLDEHIIIPVKRLVNGFDCSFMRNFWAGMTSSLCLRSMHSFYTMSVSYLVAALMSLLVAFTMYVPWRVSRDNEDIWEMSPHPEEATAVQSASPELASEAPVPPVTPNAVEAAAGDATEALGIIESQGARSLSL